MKIYQPSKNVQPKLIAIFPLGIGLLGFLVPGIHSGNSFLSIIGFILILLGVATLGAKSERFIDTHSKSVVSIKKWLFIQSKETVPLHHFKYIRVIENSTFNAEHDHTRDVYDVNLVAKNSSSDHSGGLDLTMFLGQYPRTEEGRAEAIAFGNTVASQLGLPLQAGEISNKPS